MVGLHGAILLREFSFLHLERQAPAGLSNRPERAVTCVWKGPEQPLLRLFLFVGHAVSGFRLFYIGEMQRRSVAGSDFASAPRRAMIRRRSFGAAHAGGVMRHLKTAGLVAVVGWAFAPIVQAPAGNSAASSDANAVVEAEAQTSDAGPQSSPKNPPPTSLSAEPNASPSAPVVPDPAPADVKLGAEPAGAGAVVAPVKRSKPVMPKPLIAEPKDDALPLPIKKPETVKASVKADEKSTPSGKRKTRAAEDNTADDRERVKKGKRKKL